MREKRWKWRWKNYLKVTLIEGWGAGVECQDEMKNRMIVDYTSSGCWRGVGRNGVGWGRQTAISTIPP